MNYLIDCLAVAVFAFHLIAMNLASAGPLASLWFDWRVTDRLVSHAAARYLAGLSLAALLAGAALGAGLMALMWSPEATKAIYSLLQHKVHYGVVELVFSLLLIGGQYVWLRRSPPQSSRAARIGRALLVLAATSNLMYHFPPLFAVAAKIAHGWRPAAESITPQLFREQMVTPEVASQSIHFVLASLAAAGIAALGYSLRLRGEAGIAAEAVDRVARIGGRMALVPTLLQIIVGMWVLLALPSAAQRRLMGGDALASGLFVLALAAALGLMHLLGSIAMGDVDRPSIQRAIAAFGATVVLMTAVLYLT